jgi:hypothetical protein
VGWWDGGVTEKTVVTMFYSAAEVHNCAQLFISISIFVFRYFSSPRIPFNHDPGEGFEIVPR